MAINYIKADFLQQDALHPNTNALVDKAIDLALEINCKKISKLVFTIGGAFLKGGENRIMCSEIDDTLKKLPKTEKVRELKRLVSRIRKQIIGNFEFVDESRELDSSAALALLDDPRFAEISPNTISFNIIIHKQEVTAAAVLELLNDPRFAKVVPDTVTFSTIINKQDVTAGTALALLDDSRFAEVVPNTITFNTIIKKNDITAAAALALLDDPRFAEVVPNTITFNTIIHKQEVTAAAALELLDNPRFAEAKPDAITLRTLLRKSDFNNMHTQIMSDTRFAGIEHEQKLRGRNKKATQ